MFVFFHLFARTFSAEDPNSKAIVAIKVQPLGDVTLKEFKANKHIYDSCKDRAYITIANGYQRRGNYMLFLMEYCDMGVYFFISIFHCFFFFFNSFYLELTKIG